MQSLLIVSPHPPSRELLSRMLAEPGLRIEVAEDGDAALERLAVHAPVAVVVDLRRSDEDQPLLLGLLGRRHPSLALICLLPGVVRVKEEGLERIYSVGQGHPGDLEALLAVVQRAARGLRAQHLLGLLRPELGEA